MVETQGKQIEECEKSIRALKDTIDVFSGKWKLFIIGTLIIKGTLRFMELKRALPGIAPKKLSKDLQELEMNQLVTRTVKDTKPITVEYAITEHGKSLEEIIRVMIDWGLNYRQGIKDN